MRWPLQLANPRSREASLRHSTTLTLGKRQGRTATATSQVRLSIVPGPNGETRRHATVKRVVRRILTPARTLRQTPGVPRETRGKDPIGAGTSVEATVAPETRGEDTTNRLGNAALVTGDATVQDAPRPGGNEGVGDRGSRAVEREEPVGR